ncbi:hypothetical protein AWZ03_005696 [Drosophila navojoa]|uniref:C2H2-type domain-containing protein n=1 Tax=Drosophila navojoa TaxID=7232 RepID=A0A484BJD2_DRONA|nr:hypothetical protein AWZ03_005696 [Drosophila navojoa]
MNRLMLHQSEECQDFKRFQCDYCLKWFKRRSHLNRHKKLHQAEESWHPNQRQNQKQHKQSKTTTTTTTTTASGTTAASRRSISNPVRKYNLRGQDSATPSTSKQLTKVKETTRSENEEPSTAQRQSPINNNNSSNNNSNNNNVKKPLVNNTDALIALQQLASISTARSLQHLVPHLPQNLHIDTSSLVAGRKLPRQSSKRTPQYESNRCPLCARVYRSQAFLNEHMRKEHSVLI